MDYENPGDSVRGEAVEGCTEDPRPSGSSGVVQSSFDIVPVVEQACIAVVEIDQEVATEGLHWVWVRVRVRSAISERAPSRSGGPQ